MATAIVIIPPICPIRFVEMGKVMNSAYNIKHLDDFWISDSRLPFQNDSAYKAKAQFNDNTWLQFHHNGTYSCDMFLIDCNGVSIPLSTVPIVRYHKDFAGNVYDKHGTITPVALHTSTFKVQWRSLVENGTYFLRIEVYYNAAKTLKVQYISEPILYKTKHLKTFCLDYAHYANDKGIFWSYIDISNPAIKWDIIFRLRLDGYLEDFNIESHDIFYEDQTVDLRLLDSNPYRKQTLFGGDCYGMADYHIEKMVRAFSCSYTLVDNKRFVKEDGAKIEISVKDQLQIKRADLELREYYNADAGVFETTYDDGSSTGGGGETSPAGGAGSIVITTLSGKTAPLTGWRIMETTEQWDDYMIEATASIHGQTPEDYIATPDDATYPLGLYGVFSYTEGQGWRYIADTNDAFIPTFSGVYYPIIFKTEIENTTGQNVIYTYTFTGGAHVVDWDDGTIEEIIYNGQGNVPQTVQHTYPDGNYQVKMYHDDSGLDALSIDGGTMPVTNIDGLVPQTLQSISIINATFSNFDFEKLQNAASRMHEIVIKDSGVSSLTLTTFSPQLWTGGIKKIDLSGNALDSTSIDDLINTIANDMVLLGDGYLNLSGQNPVAYRTSASDESIAYISGAGWKVILDIEQQQQ